MIKSIKKLIQDFKDAGEFGEYDFRCKECGEIVNAMEQSGICPHIPVKEFIYGSENADADDDQKTEKTSEF